MSRVTSRHAARWLLLAATVAFACDHDPPRHGRTVAAQTDHRRSLEVEASVVAEAAIAGGRRVVVGGTVTTNGARPPTTITLAPPNGAAVVITMLDAHDWQKIPHGARATFTFEHDVPSCRLAWTLCVTQPPHPHGHPVTQVCIPLSLRPNTGDPVGCADGTREGFVDAALYPDIAGCSGGFTVPGLHTHNPGIAPACPGLPTYETRVPTCGRVSGNDSENPTGVGCTVEDLCAPGWHVCRSSAEVGGCSPTGCDGSVLPGDPLLFFATRQTGPGYGMCATGTRTDLACGDGTLQRGCAQTERTSDDFFGCGNHGVGTGTNTGCEPLNLFSDDSCTRLGGTPWYRCGLHGGPEHCEAYRVVKPGPEGGGVLCCRD